MFGRLKLDDIVIFTNQLSSMITAEVPLPDVLNNLAEETPNPVLQNAIYDIREQVNRGIDFSDAVAERADIFTPIYINMIRAGMSSGMLKTTLKQLSRYLTQSAETEGKVKSALTYPAIMLVVMTIVVYIMLTRILPMFQTMYNTLGGELPEITRFVLKISAFLQEYGLLSFILAGGLAAGFIIFIKTPDGRYWWDGFRIKIPVLGPLMFKASVSKFIRTLGVMVESNVEIIESLEISGSSTGNVLIEDKIWEATERIKKGWNLADSFRKEEIFPNIIIQMISSGEETGKLDTLLLSAADYYDRIVENTIESVVTFINPAVTIIMGIIVGGMMLAMFAPIVKMGGM